MSRQARCDTAPEVALRRELHRRGLRFRLQVKVPSNQRRTIDIAFTRARVAVFVDGCFWHGCPQHATMPKANGDWWANKLAGNNARDANTTALLAADGWLAVRVWEHEDVVSAADRVERAVVDRGAQSGS